MPEHERQLLTAWLSFYVMTGSSAAALTGLMFVVITLVTGTELAARRDGLATFSTPTVFHFAMALLVSAILSAPWHTLFPPAVLTGLAALYGVVYIIRIASLASRLTKYVPDTEDWVWYSLLPLLGFCAVLGGAIALPQAEEEALYAIAAGVLLLIFIGIRNAWDIVTYLAIQSRNRPPG